MQKVVRFYVMFSNGDEFESGNFNVRYESIDAFIYLLKDIYSVVHGRKIEDIYINEPIYDSNGNLIEEIPLASYYELLKSQNYILKYTFPTLKMETSSFYNVVNACINDPLMVKTGGIHRDEYYPSGSSGTYVDPEIYQNQWLVMGYGCIRIEYPIQDILALNKCKRRVI